MAEREPSCRQGLHLPCSSAACWGSGPPLQLCPLERRPWSALWPAGRPVLGSLSLGWRPALGHAAGRAPAPQSTAPRRRRGPPASAAIWWRASASLRVGRERRQAAPTRARRGCRGPQLRSDPQRQWPRSSFARATAFPTLSLHFLAASSRFSPEKASATKTASPLFSESFASPCNYASATLNAL